MEVCNLAGGEEARPERGELLKRLRLVDHRTWLGFGFGFGFGPGLGLGLGLGLGFG